MVSEALAGLASAAVRTGARLISSADELHPVEAAAVKRALDAHLAGPVPVAP